MGVNNYKKIMGNVLLSIFALSFLTGCNTDEQYFTSGLAKEWAQQNPVTLDQLAMNPEHYLRGLGDDLGQLAWLAIPKGKLFNDMRDQHRIEDIQALLAGYVTLLEMLPQHEQLPEYQLSSLYLDLADDYVAYIEGNVSMYSITNKIAGIDQRAQQYEVNLADAGQRRLEVMLNTLRDYKKDNGFLSHSALPSKELQLVMNTIGN